MDRKRDYDAEYEHWDEMRNSDDGWDRVEAEVEIRHLMLDEMYENMTDAERFVDYVKNHLYTPSSKRRARRKIWRYFNTVA